MTQDWSHQGFVAIGKLVVSLTIYVEHVLVFWILWGWVVLPISFPQAGLLWSVIQFVAWPIGGAVRQLRKDSGELFTWGERMSIFALVPLVALGMAGFWKWMGG